MTDESTCGQGIAEHSVLPKKLAHLLAAQADVLANHLDALDDSDTAARPEVEAYTELIEMFRAGAEHLATIASRMAGYRDLPMAPHDVERLASIESVGVFRRFVAAEQEAVALLQSMVEEHQAMLA